MAERPGSGIGFTGIRFGEKTNPVAVYQSPEPGLTVIGTLSAEITNKMTKKIEKLVISLEFGCRKGN